MNATTLPARRAKIGRPTKFTPETRARILSCVEMGTPLVHAANASGVSYQSLNSYRAAHPRFADALSAAVSRGIEARLDVIKRAMKSKDESIALRAATWWLSHTPDAARYFSDSSRMELTGADGGPLDGRIAVLIWPHERTSSTPHEILDATDDHPAAITPGTD